jgi:ribonuclease BN (tRNA processing enzyme)
VTADTARVRLRFIGCGDAFAAGGRFHTCFHLDGGEQAMLIDCGVTSLVALKREGIDPASVGWVALTHLHGDHFGGLPWLILDGQFAGRTRPLVIAGPPGTEARLEQAFEALYPGATSTERPFEIRFVELEPRVPRELGPAVVTALEAVHGGGAPSYGLRVQYGGRLIAYSGDTEWTDALLELADGADLFICECNEFDRSVPGHLSYRTLTERRSELRCQRLILTHLGREMLAHLDEVEIESAHDGAVIEL